MLNGNTKRPNLNEHRQEGMRWTLQYQPWPTILCSAGFWRVPRGMNQVVALDLNSIYVHRLWDTSVNPSMLIITCLAGEWEYLTLQKMRWFPEGRHDQVPKFN